MARVSRASALASTQSYQAARRCLLKDGQGQQGVRISFDPVIPGCQALPFVLFDNPVPCSGLNGILEDILAEIPILGQTLFDIETLFARKGQ